MANSSHRVVQRGKHSLTSFRLYNTPEELSSDQWQSVLRLGKVFRLDDVTQKAARNLKDIFFAGDLVEALICAKENNFDDWIQPLVGKIVSRRRYLNELELEKIGMKIVIKIAWAQGATGITMPEPPKDVGKGKMKKGKK
jgi:hypothetical protein